MGYRCSSGQSAIEYLMTYGWMLLVVAVTGGAVFATVGDQGVESTSGLDGDVQIDNFGISNQDELGLEVRDGSGQGITVSKVNVSDPDTGQWIYKEFTGENRVGVGSSKIFELPNVTQSDSTNELGVEITYDSEGLSNLSEEGTINGQLELNNTGSFEGLPEDDHQSIDDSGDTGGSVSLMQTVNYTYDGSGDVQVNETTAGSNGYQVDLNNDFSSEVEKIEIAEMHGADGGDGGASNNEAGDGGSGGLIQNYNVSVKSLDILQVWAGKTPCCAGNSYGRSDGGQEYGGGGGSTELWADDNSTFIAAADGGGGGAGIPSDAFFGVDDDYSAGGGGGRGGLGGTATKSDGSTFDGADGQSFDCGSLSCAGGDGGDANEQTGTLEDGDPGGQEINTSLVTDSGSQNLGGSDSGSGWILLKYYG